MKFLGGQHWLLVDVVYHLLSTICQLSVYHLLSTNCQVTVYHMLTAYLSIFTYLWIHYFIADMERERNALLVPCGHYKFCLPCANSIVNGDAIQEDGPQEARCPICRD